jgi:hypothetical protein
MLIAISIIEIIVCVFLYKKLNFSLALIFLFLFLTFDILSFKQFEKFKQDHLDSIILFGTIITTFLGVYCAINFTNAQTEKDNKKKVIQLIEAAYGELYQSRTNLNRMVGEAEKLFEGLDDLGFKKKFKKGKTKGFIVTFRRPEIIDFILHNELGLSHLPYDTIITLTSINTTIDEIYNRVNFSRFNKLENYISSLKNLVLIHDILSEVLNLTTSLIKEKITIEQWKSQASIEMNKPLVGHSVR